MTTRRRSTRKQAAALHAGPAHPSIIKWATMATPMLLTVFHSRMMHLATYGHVTEDHVAICEELRARNLL